MSGAVGICYSDVELFEGSRPAPYASYPIIPGHEWCGTVVAVGADVKRNFLDFCDLNYFFLTLLV